MKRYDPNPHLIAPSTEQRMVLAVDGDYVRIDELMEALKPGTKQIVLCLKCNDTGYFPIGSSCLCNHIYPALEIDLHSEILALKAQRDVLDRALHELASACGMSDKDVRALIDGATVR